MPSFSKLATVTASTKRSAGIVDGLETGYTETIASLKCLPLDPINPDLMLGIEGLGWRETLETTISGAQDVQEGDLFVVSGTEYPVRAVAEWTWKGSEFSTIYLEEIK